MSSNPLFKKFMAQYTVGQTGSQKTEEWNAEYKRLGAIYANWGALFAIFGTPSALLAESKFTFENPTLWILFRLMPSLIIAIAYIFFRIYKYNHEILFLIIAYSLFIDYAYWPDCNNQQIFLYGQITLLIPVAFVTLLRPYFYLINIFIQLLTCVVMYQFLCNHTLFAFLKLKEFVPILIGSITAYSVAVFRYYLIKKNFVFSLLLKEALDLAKSERDKSDRLLENILPIEVADELKKNGMAKARYYENVTVMFTDFKHFTNISEQLTPDQLVDELNYCFTAFDHIIEQYGLEKIKTIGDSYMCAGGLPKVNDTHVLDVICAAKAIISFMKEHNLKRSQQNKHQFEIRIGINTGHLVAGIIGINKFAYDIWGDTVNIASRMESSGEEGRINISGSTYDQLKGKIPCEYRGKIKAKNKGEIDMYFVS